MVCSDSKSLLGTPDELKPGMFGFHEDWVHRVCPDHLPWIAFHMWEIVCGNSFAHEMLLLMIAGNEQLARKIVIDEGVVLPGMAPDSASPPFWRTNTLMPAVRQLVKTTFNGEIDERKMMQLKGAYLSLVNKCSPDAIHTTAGPTQHAHAAAGAAAAACQNVCGTLPDQTAHPAAPEAASASRERTSGHIAPFDVGTDESRICGADFEELVKALTGAPGDDAVVDCEDGLSVHSHPGNLEKLNLEDSSCGDRHSKIQKIVRFRKL